MQIDTAQLSHHGKLLGKMAIPLDPWGSIRAAMALLA
jgi:hypothetical protein